MRADPNTQDALNDITDAASDFERDVAYPFVPANRRRVDAYRRAIVLEEMALEDERQRRQRAGLTETHDTSTAPPAPPTTATMASSSSSSTTTSRRKRAGTTSAGAKPGESKKPTTAQEKGKGKARETRAQTTQTAGASSSTATNRAQATTRAAERTQPPAQRARSKTRARETRTSPYEFTEEELKSTVVSCPLVSSDTFCQNHRPQSRTAAVRTLQEERAVPPVREGDD